MGRMIDFSGSRGPDPWERSRRDTPRNGPDDTPPSPVHSCPRNFACVVALPTAYRAIFRRTFIAIFYMPVSVSPLEDTYFLTISRWFRPSGFLPFRYRRYKREPRVYRREIFRIYDVFTSFFICIDSRSETFLCLVILS